jgi:hypothetical protein
LELRAIGNLVTVKCNVQIVVELRDDTHQRGSFGVTCGGQAAAEIKALHFPSLDAR